MRVQSPIIFAILIVSSGCCSTPPAQIPLPECRQPIPVTGEIWNDLGMVREVLSENSLIYQECLEKYRARVTEFNEQS